MSNIPALNVSALTAVAPAAQAITEAALRAERDALIDFIFRGRRAELDELLDLGLDEELLKDRLFDATGRDHDAEQCELLSEMDDDFRAEDF